MRKTGLRDKVVCPTHAVSIIAGILVLEHKADFLNLSLLNNEADFQQLQTD